ncbi:MAG: magnesium transporter CorA family protein [Blastocatellia bacterium]|nr:magnesium transporter CorA family protein [Blastocatellia bacterium]
MNKSIGELSSIEKIEKEAIFHGVSFNRRDYSVRYFGCDELHRELTDLDVFSWIDIEGANIEALNEVLRLVEVDLLLVNDFNKPEILPRIVERFDCLAFYIYEVAYPERHLDTSLKLKEIEFVRMILVISQDYIITYHQSPMEVVEEVKVSCAENFKLAGKTPGFIAFLLMNRCLYDYAHLNLANDNFLDSLETSVISGTHKDAASKVSTAAANILTLKKMVNSLQIVLMVIVTKRNKFISDEARTSFSQMLQNTLSVRDSIDSSRDLLDGIISGFQVQAANRTSDIARVLTVVSTIILPLTLISGVYGMNFENMPELRAKTGYFIVLVVMFLVALILIAVFMRLGWIGTRFKKREVQKQD